MVVIKHITEMQAWANQARAGAKRIGFVPTMGYLHEGHLSLVRVAKAQSDAVVASIFVNPLQFGPAEDLARYPRDFDRDRAMLVKEGVDVVFYPEAAEMYPTDFTTLVQVSKLTETLCGRSRPGHFQGVTTVVAKLFTAVKPHLAVFGSKDAQQALVIKRMARDLNFDIEIIIAPTIRESDGLALSSRNSFLKPLERQQAATLFRALRHAEELIALGERLPQKVINAISDMIVRETSGAIDYVALVDVNTLQDVKEIRGQILIALAVFFGKTRLIDNILVQAP